MKKFLNFIGTILLSSSFSTIAISCGTPTDKTPVNDDDKKEKMGIERMLSNTTIDQINIKNQGVPWNITLNSIQEILDGIRFELIENNTQSWGESDRHMLNVFLNYFFEKYEKYIWIDKDLVVDTKINWKNLGEYLEDIKKNGISFELNFSTEELKIIGDKIRDTEFAEDISRDLKYDFKYAITTQTPILIKVKEVNFDSDTTKL